MCVSNCGLLVGLPEQSRLSVALLWSILNDILNRYALLTANTTVLYCGFVPLLSPSF